MSSPFKYDVFLSHSAKDKSVVRELAEKLFRDGLKVWFDEWIIKPGDSIQEKTEEGLELSRVLVFCMSANSFGSDWTQLEAGTFRFRDPINKDRRFIPLRLDDAPIIASVYQFAYISWKSFEKEKEYARLLEACRDPGLENLTFDQYWVYDLFTQLNVGFNLKSISQCVAFKSDLDLVCAGEDDGLIEVWEKNTGKIIQVLKGHSSAIWCVDWNKDGTQIISGSYDGQIKIWSVPTGKCLRSFNIKGIREKLKNSQGFIFDEGITSIKWSPDNQLVVFGSGNNIFVCDPNKLMHTEVKFVSPDIINELAWSRAGNRIISGSVGGSIRIWDTVNYKSLHLLSGHTGRINCISYSPNGRFILSSSDDRTIRIWDAESGHCRRVLEGHSNPVERAAWSSDGNYILSCEAKGHYYLWETVSGRNIFNIKFDASEVLNIVWSPDSPIAFVVNEWGKICSFDFSNFLKDQKKFNVPDNKNSEIKEQIQYSNAKVLLVGESGVGKTGLSNYLAHGVKVEENKPLPSTDGAWASHWPLKSTKKNIAINREIWLWDFAGQVDYRLVHQLFMEDTAAAVLVFNPQNEDPIESLEHWDQDIKRAAQKPFVKLLAAARIDRGALVVSAQKIKEFIKKRGFRGPIHLTSSKTGAGCDDLRKAIVEAIDWKNIPETTSPALYHRLKQEILGLREIGMTLIRWSELKQRMELTLGGENFKLEELKAVIGLLAGPGMVLNLGDFILLRPEILSRYAAAVVRKVRQHPQELGCISEEDLLLGNLDYQDFERLPKEEEKIILETLLEIFVRKAWCLRQKHDNTTILTFPNYFRRERDKQPDHPNVVVTYRFSGPLDEIYTTLVVRLHHSVPFKTDQLWKDAADFKTQTDKRLGLTITREKNGAGYLEVYFAPDVQTDSQLLFLGYIHEHLLQYDPNVVRLRHYCCGNKKCTGFEKPFKDREAINEALRPTGTGKVFCTKCGRPIPLRDLIENKFDSANVKDQVFAIQNEVQAVLDNESRELKAVYHTGFIVTGAGQIYRGYTNSDHGIDGEIEFKNEKGQASGKRLYLQIKSGDSHLKKRKSDGAEVFHIKNQRWAHYWQQHAYTVMLVIRTSNEEIRWMDISSYLKQMSANGKPIRKIVFKGELLDVMSVRRWKDKVLDIPNSH
jgi:small GTP-binding protein